MSSNTIDLLTKRKRGQSMFCRHDDRDGSVMLEVHNAHEVIDDGLVGSADVVAVFEDAAQYQPGDAVHTQSQRGLG